jgi:hypothetical protein
MNNLRTSRDYIEDVLKLNKFAVLATEGNGQPHTCLIAITPFETFRQLIFAIYRNTLNYRILTHYSKEAIHLVYNKNQILARQPSQVILYFASYKICYPGYRSRQHCAPY